MSLDYGFVRLVMMDITGILPNRFVINALKDARPVKMQFLVLLALMISISTKKR